MGQERNLSLPGNPRYQPAALQPYFGYDALYQPLADVEIAVLDTLGDLQVIPSQVIDELTPELRSRLRDITTTDVDRVERSVTQHDVRAWIRLAQEVLGGKAIAQWVHLLLTSYDPLATAQTLQFIRVHEAVVRPRIASVCTFFANFVERTAGVPQIGRTHGQHAIPITAGFWLATVLSRILENARRMDMAATQLVGKISGAVGAHNAQIAFGAQRNGQSPSFEERVLAKLGLQPPPVSTQILPPEPLACYLFASLLETAALGQLGRDCRHLMRSEIGEIAEHREEGAIGSSTMAHKVNPIRFENLKGMWLRTRNEFGKIFETLISEHQRDLVGSSLMRDFPIIIVNLVVQLETLLRTDKCGQPFLTRLQVSDTACRRNLMMSGTAIMAEPMYIALQMAGYRGDAHALLNDRLVPESRERGITLVTALLDASDRDEDLSEVIGRIPDTILTLLDHPEQYVGDAEAQARAIAAQALEYAQF